MALDRRGFLGNLLAGMGVAATALPKPAGALAVRERLDGGEPVCSPAVAFVEAWLNASPENMAEDERITAAFGRLCMPSEADKLFPQLGRERDALEDCINGFAFASVASPLAALGFRLPTLTRNYETGSRCNHGHKSRGQSIGPLGAFDPIVQTTITAKNIHQIEQIHWRRAADAADAMHLRFGVSGCSAGFFWPRRYGCEAWTKAHCRVVLVAQHPRLILTPHEVLQELLKVERLVSIELKIVHEIEFVQSAVLSAASKALL